MNGLKRLLEIQKGTKRETATGHAGDGSQDADDSPAATNISQSKSGKLSQQGKSAPGAADKPKPKTGGLLSRLNTIGSGGVGGTGSSNAPAAGASRQPTASDSVDSDSDDSGLAELTLDDIARLDASTTEEVRAEPERSGFVDEIEATAPDRVLDPSLTQQQLEFVESLDSIYGILNDPELFGQTVRYIMIELQDHEEYMDLVSDHDIHVMIQAMRNTMGLAQIKKQEKKRGAGGRKKQEKKLSVREEDALALLDSLGFDGD